VTETAVAPAEEWRRTNPLSFLVGAITSLRNAGLPALAALIGTGAWKQGLVAIVPAFAALLLFTAFFSWIAWRHFRYRLGDGDIRVERGLFSKTARSVPYERIQDVSLEQTLVPRLFGMVDVKFETGAGGKDEVRIRYVTAAEAEALRETVRARKAGDAVAPDAPALPAEEAGHTLFAMDAKRLTTFGVFEFSLVVFAVLGGALQQFDFLLSFDVWDFRGWLHLFAGPGHWLQELGFAAQVIGAAIALTLLGLVGLVTGLGRTALRDWGFRLEETPKGLRRRRGLLTRTDVVMRLHRVQALKVTTGILRRRFGWYGLGVVSLAQEAKSESHVVVPFGTMDEIAPVVRTTGFALPDDATEWHRSARQQRTDSVVLTLAPFAALAAVVATIATLLVSRPGEVPAGWPMLAAAGLAVVGGFLALREWHLWRHSRHAIDARQLYVRHGWLAPRLDIASRVKLQSVEIAQGPLARRRGYADLKFGVAGGTLEMHGVPLDEARAIRAAVLDSIAAVDFSRLPG
jgi:putative membrane protein